MDKVKAIKVLKPLANSFVDYANITMKEEDDDTAEALEMAIEALKAQLSQEGTTSDVISRQQALDAVGKYASVWMEYTDAMSKDEIAQIALNNTKSTMIRILKELPSAQPEPQWIPVSERLPEVHESGNSVSGIYMQSNPVLVYGTCEYEDNAQFHVATYCDDLDGNTYWSTELDAITVSGVLAWMPLPEAYKPNNK